MSKYAAAILTMLALAGTGWAIVVVTRPMPLMSLPSGAAPELNQQLQASEREISHLQGLDATLSQVDSLTTSTQAPAAMLALYSSQHKTSATAGQNQSAKIDISLVYISPDLQKVVINGMLLGIGDILPDGGTLTSITQEQIVIKQGGHRTVLRLPEPHVLGMAPNPTNTP
ncbi:MAG: hypothetical protein KKH74_12770 [Gammaproteobacteria bacterium]|nr:hypothetical protein [Gammaproteobacteria bacterium]MBU1731866.1 hypothetical protein [Gammaproteobacteria bacterium]MBU1892477.1 hypothetical protein [Gammaproteobacteria bacterium]